MSALKTHPTSEGWLHMEVELTSAEPLTEKDMKLIASMGRPEQKEFGPWSQRGKILHCCSRERKDQPPPPPPEPKLPLVGSHVSLETIELAHIKTVLATAGSLQEAAIILAIDPATLYRKRKRYALDD